MDRRTLYIEPTHRLRLASIQILSSQVGHASGTWFPKLKIAFLNPRGALELIQKIEILSREPDTYPFCSRLDSFVSVCDAATHLLIGLAATKASPILRVLTLGAHRQ